MYIFRGKSNGSQEVKNLLLLQCLKLVELDCGIVYRRRRKFSAELYLAMLVVRFLQAKLKTDQRFSYAHARFIYRHFTAHEERKDVDF